MQKKIIIFLLVLILCGCQSVVPAASLGAAAPYSYEDYIELELLITEQQERKENAHIMAEAARALGYSNDHIIIQTAKEEWWAAEKARHEYHTLQKELQTMWETKELEYPEATRVWILLKSYGLADAIAAGLLGNFMVETAGQTLDINPLLYSKTGGHYGLVQWSRQYYPDVQGADVPMQIAFLMETMEYEFTVYGKVYKSGFTYQDFLELTDPRQVALAFAKVYERCGSGSYSARQNCATIAYNYFCGVN